jgi:type II secretory pathway predicted ATPase ExeA
MPQAALKRLLQTLAETNRKVSQNDAARACKVGPSVMSRYVNGEAPARGVADLERHLRKYLLEAGATEAQADTALKRHAPKKAAAKRTATPPTPSEPADHHEDHDMLLKRTNLTDEAKRKFNLFRAPFADDLEGPAEVFLSADIRRVREAMLFTAKRGGFTGIVGESGAGKTVCLQDMMERIAEGNDSIIVIEPYVLGMEQNDQRGRTLKSAHIGEAVLSALKVNNLSGSPQARFNRAHNALKESYQAGNRHVLVIEEAHALPTPTLNHLKRWQELHDGFKRLIGVILLGQTELAQRLSASDKNVREVAQRCELIWLHPLDNELQKYIEHRCKTASMDWANLFDANVADAVRARLVQPYRQGQQPSSLLYPLAVNNLLNLALNKAASAGLRRVTAELVREVQS